MLIDECVSVCINLILYVKNRALFCTGIFQTPNLISALHFMVHCCVFALLLCYLSFITWISITQDHYCVNQMKWAMKMMCLGAVYLFCEDDVHKLGSFFYYSNWVNFEPEHTHLVLLSCELVEECEPSFSFNPDVASTANKCDLVSFQEITVADWTSIFLLIEMFRCFSSVKRNHIYAG